MNKPNQEFKPANPHVTIADCIEILKLDSTPFHRISEDATAATIVRAQAMAAKRVEDALRESGK
jgi:hypothetical protein